VSEALRILVVDDHPVYRDGLAALLRSVDGLEVAGTAADGAAAVAAVHELDPDVVVMDIQMPVLDGIEATRQIAAATPSTAIIMLTMSEDDETVFAAVRAGARGYLLKGADQEEIVRGITTVAAGGAVFGPALAMRIASFFGGGAPATPAPATPASGPAAPAARNDAFPQLSAREREVLDLVASGRTNAQIAEFLFLSPKTIRNTVSNIFSKLQLADRAAAIIAARDAGLGRH